MKCDDELYPQQLIVLLMQHLLIPVCWSLNPYTLLSFPIAEFQEPRWIKSKWFPEWAMDSPWLVTDSIAELQKAVQWLDIHL